VRIGETMMTSERRPTRRLSMLGATALLSGAALLTGCSSSTGDGSATAATAPTPTAAPATGTLLQGKAFRFRLPAGMTFTPYADSTSPSGARLRKWRYPIRPGGPFCLVNAAEQANFTGSYPASSIALFEADKRPGDVIVRNAVVNPPMAGASGEVAQENTFSTTLDDGTKVAERQVVRDVLTTGHTLVDLWVAGPDRAPDTCQIRSIAASFELTGQEADVTSTSSRAA
jgi:hypothetical protein